MNNSRIQIKNVNGFNIDYTVDGALKRINSESVNMIRIDRSQDEYKLLIGNGVFSGKSFRAQQERFDRFDDALSFSEYILDNYSSSDFAEIEINESLIFIRKSAVSMIDTSRSGSISIAINGVIVQTEVIESDEEIKQIFDALE